MTHHASNADLVRFGIIGCGLMGYRHAMAIRAQRATSITAVTDLNPASAQKLADLTGAAVAPTHADLLARADVDAVVIATPDDAHLVPALDAIAARKHVLLEKPLAMDMTEARQILAAAEALTDRVVMVGHLLRFDSRFVHAAQAVRRGEIGEVCHVSLRRNSNIGGPLRYGAHVSLPFHVSVHDVDLLRFITGLEITRVTARARSHVLADQGKNDSLFAILDLSSGALAAMEACWILPASYQTALDGWVEIVGTDGAICLDTISAGVVVADEHGFHYPDVTRYFEADGRGGGLPAQQMAHFLQCIDENLAPRASVRDAFQAVRVADAIRRSIQAGQPVHLTDNE